MGSAQRTPALSRRSSIQRRADILLYRPLILSLGRTGARGAYAPSQPLETPYGHRRRIRPAIATTRNGVRPHHAVTRADFIIFCSRHGSGLGGGGGEGEGREKCKSAKVQIALRPVQKTGRVGAWLRRDLLLRSARQSLAPTRERQLGPHVVRSLPEAAKLARSANPTSRQADATQSRPYPRRLGRYAIPTLPRDMRTVRSAKPTRGNVSHSVVPPDDEFATPSWVLGGV